MRAEIAASEEAASALAQRYGITERSVFGDRSHTVHRLQAVLKPAQEIVAAHLRRTLLLPLDDLLAVTREFICPMSYGRAWIGACAAMEQAASSPRSTRTCTCSISDPMIVRDVTVK